MTQDEMIEMAKQAGMVKITTPTGIEIDEWWGVELSDIEHFAKLVAEKELTDAQNTIRQLAEKLECYERLADVSEIASNPMGVKSREALKNVREMKTIMTKEEEIRKAVEAEREACAKVADEYANGLERNYSEIIADLIRARSKHD